MVAVLPRRRYLRVGLSPQARGHAGRGSRVRTCLPENRKSIQLVPECVFALDCLKRLFAQQQPRFFWRGFSYRTHRPRGGSVRSNPPHHRVLFIFRQQQVALAGETFQRRPFLYFDVSAARSDCLFAFEFMHANGH